MAKRRMWRVSKPPSDIGHSSDIFLHYLCRKMIEQKIVEMDPKFFFVRHAFWSFKLLYNFP